MQSWAVGKWQVFLPTVGLQPGEQVEGEVGRQP